ncbi:MAG: hypothetical protein ACI4U3_02450 [Traorella sp.]
MKSLSIIQKTCHVFQVLSKIAMIVSFIWAIFCMLGVAAGMVWQNGGRVIGLDQSILFSISNTNGLKEMTIILFTDMIFALCDGILFAYSHYYLKCEQEDGTPFTKRGANCMRHLGIMIIILPCIVNLVMLIIQEIYQVSSIDLNNSYSVMLGISLIVMSLVLAYGAELEGKTKEVLEN